MKRIVFGKRRTSNIALLPTITYDSFRSDGYKIAEVSIWFVHWIVFTSIAFGKKKNEQKKYDRGTAKESWLCHQVAASR